MFSIRTKAAKSWGPKALVSICDHELGGNIYELKETIFNSSTNPMMTNIDVLGAAMMFGVDSKGEGALIVTVKANRDLFLAMSEFGEQSRKPNDLLACFCKAYILRLTGR